MDANIVRVKIELDLIEGEHFNPSNRELSKEELEKEAMKSFFAWIDSFFTDDTDTYNIYEYMQAKVIGEN